MADPGALAVRGIGIDQLANAIAATNIDQATGALCAGTGARLHLSGDEVLGPKRLGARAVALDDQDVAVGQSIESARVLEPLVAAATLLSLAGSRIGRNP